MVRLQGLAALLAASGAALAQAPLAAVRDRPLD